MPDEINERVRRIVSALFGVDEDSIGPGSKQGDFPKWDSMGHLMLILEIEQAFDVKLTPEQMEQAQSVGSLVDCLRGAGAPGGK